MPSDTPPTNVAAIDCNKLTFAWRDGEEPVLHDMDLQLKRGDRCLLIGANGGASTVETTTTHT